MTNPVLVEVIRGGIVESMHRGAAAVVDADGRLVFELGDIERPVFPRSAIKVLQALPLVESGAAARLGFGDAELALACASHSGEADHTETAAGMLQRVGHDVSCLECGKHWPMYDPAARALAAAGSEPSALHNNCSGKHAGFVCLAVEMGADPKGYIGPDHKVMREVSGAIETMTGYNLANAAVGIDGCSIPTYAIPLRHLAHAFAKIASGVSLGPERAKAAIRLRAAVAAEPRMIAGTDRFDTLVTEVLKERVFLKTGAEGVYCAALPELGFGIALKVDDGEGRAAQTAIASLIDRFLALKPAEKEMIGPRLDWPMKNWNGIEVGRLHAADQLTVGVVRPA